MWTLRTPADAGDDTERLLFRVTSRSARTIGRAPHADFVLDRPLVSRVHCRLTSTDDRLEVEDLSSTNGTYVNDQRVVRKSLAPGDRLRVGRTELVVGQDG